MRAAGRETRWPSDRSAASYFFDPGAGLAATKPFVDGAEAFVFTLGTFGFFASRLPRLLSVAMSASLRGPVT
jgi:hypothetical protein